jgi:hypothetical protein
VLAFASVPYRHIEDGPTAPPQTGYEAVTSHWNSASPRSSSTSSSSRDERQLSRTIARYGRVDLLYIDELVPGRLVRPFYSALKAPLLALGARGRRAR